MECCSNSFRKGGNHKKQFLGRDAEAGGTVSRQDKASKCATTLHEFQKSKINFFFEQQFRNPVNNKTHKG
jgi:hypothetical protein